MSEARKLRRRLVNGMGYTSPGAALPTRGYLEAELDRRRMYFTEELVKLGVEELNFESFSDTQKEVLVEGMDYATTEPTMTMEGWFLAVTKAAKAAAEELYPELPEEEI